MTGMVKLFSDMLTNMFLAFMAAISPGPNIVLVIQNSLVFGRRYGLMTALGVLSGVFFWLLFLMIGFTYLLQNPKVFFFFHSFASLYLLYIVYLILKLKIENNESEMHKNSKFFGESLIITLLNPEIAIFYGSILAGIAVSNPNMGFGLMSFYLFSFMVIESIVFLSAAYFVSYVNKFILSYIWVVKICASSAILYFAIKLMGKVYADYQILFPN
jgi:threonine/homoserine/homoserine lactone efflux protein